jgi:hypothetical protein
MTVLREGWNYTTDPPTAPSYAAGEDTEEAFLPPLVLAYVADAGLDGGSAWAPVDKLGALGASLGITLQNMGVRVLDTEWGVMIEATPNHMLAKSHWSGAADSEFDPGTDGIDYEDLLVTICWEGDYRLGLSYDVPSSYAAGDGSELVIEVPGAEYWHLAPRTVLGADGAGALRYSPATSVCLRNDLARLQAIMAGAISRYAQDRLLARVTYRRLEAWGEQLGAILGLIDEGGDMSYVGAPITSVGWNFDARTTSIRTGYAQ